MEINDRIHFNEPIRAGLKRAGNGEPGSFQAEGAFLWLSIHRCGGRCGGGGGVGSSSTSGLCVARVALGTPVVSVRRRAAWTLSGTTERSEREAD